MSRIGKLPITIPGGVTITVGDDNTVTVKGPKGQLSEKISSAMELCTGWTLMPCPGSVWALADAAPKARRLQAASVRRRGAVVRKVGMNAIR